MAALRSSFEEVWRPGRHSKSFDGAALQRWCRAAPDLRQGATATTIRSVRCTNRCAAASPDGALYWFCRMLDGGADPRYLARRIVRMAWEDVGLADPRAARIALDAAETYERLGTPEGELALAQAIIYLAVAPKSNATYVAFGEAMRTAKQAGSLLPKHILNAPTRLMKSEGYGSGYEYDHDAEDAFRQDYFPEKLGRHKFYDPPERGFEREIRKRLEYWAKLRKERGAP